MAAPHYEIIGRFMMLDGSIYEAMETFTCYFPPFFILFFYQVCVEQFLYSHHWVHSNKRANKKSWPYEICFWWWRNTTDKWLQQILCQMVKILWRKEIYQGSENEVLERGSGCNLKWNNQIIPHEWGIFKCSCEGWSGVCHLNVEEQSVKQRP